MSQLLCPSCRGDAEAAVAPEIMGRHGKARVRVTGLPIRRCTYCEKTSVKYNDFLPDFVQVVTAMNTLPEATRVGLFVKKPGCSHCKALLADAETGPVNSKGTLDISDPPFEVDLSVLGTTCPKCSLQQVVLEGQPLAHDIRDAFLHACKSAAIHSPADNE